MNKWLAKRSIYEKVAFYTLLIVVIIAILSTPLFVFDIYEIPLGIILGALFSGLCYWSLELINKHEDKTKSSRWLLVFTFSRLILLGGLLALIGYLYYVVNFRAFNLFGVAGGYLIPLAILLIITFAHRKEDSVTNV